MQKLVGSIVSYVRHLTSVVTILSYTYIFPLNIDAIFPIFELVRINNAECLCIQYINDCLDVQLGGKNHLFQ